MNNIDFKLNTMNCSFWLVYPQTIDENVILPKRKKNKDVIANHIGGTFVT